MNLATVVGLFVAQLAVGAPPPTGPAKTPPAKLLREIAVLPPSHLIGAVAFSPDEQWIAITGAIQHRPGRRHYKRDLLLVPLDGSPDRAVRLDPGLPIRWGPVWSPDSNTVLVGELAGPNRGVAKLLNIRGDQLWARDAPRSPVPSRRPAGGVFGFLDNDHLLAELPPKGRPAAFATLDLHGKITDTWPVPKNWTIAAVSPDRRLIAVFSDDYQSKTLIVDYSSKTVIQSKSSATWLYRNGGRSYATAEFFTEAGKTLCAVEGPENEARPAACWDVDTGQKIAEFHLFSGGAPAAASARASRLVFTQVRQFFRRQIDSYGERVVWDFRSGAEVASLPVRGQNVWNNVDLPPAPIALSATGHYLAEGAGGILRIYELP
jgi:WD40 repeat protein